ncbi:helix-turn-helix transcriptional regulator [Massilia sp. RP-1-19]|uniref:Helix-turn-helix transcriptional regulator n=1 Tax=Massilia polaris TaxID=2728846 RepID=A0A848HKN3_9BURK|nr:helix-turn-helix transcriptional regulator [Massilia polaris]NML62436.1 helix-turn-helix transcriptional regulator [Massilia polaris]
MNADMSDTHLPAVAAAIAEPSRARILCCLMDGHARTSTELAAVAQVSASTASAHLARLKQHRLVELVAQGKHRYYKLASTDVGAALEALLVVAGAPVKEFTPTTPSRLRQARTCYDHMAGSLAVALNDHFMSQGWLATVNGGTDYALSDEGELALAALGVDVAGARTKRRRFACACLDWSERKPHLAGALGTALLQLTLKRGWVEQDMDSRALTVTSAGLRQFRARFGVHEKDARFAA